jgi:hypothetical protein
MSTCVPERVAETLPVLDVVALASVISSTVVGLTGAGVA